MELQATHPPSHAVKRKNGQASEPRISPSAGPTLDDILAQLESKLAKAKARQMAISKEREAIALAAHMGSADDRARLNQLNQEGAILSGEIESIEAAITQFRAQVADAEAAVAREAERAKRKEVLRLADEARTYAAEIDELWRASIAAYLLLQDKLHEIAQAADGRPSRHQVQAACRRALISAFIGSPLQLELLAPGERRSVSSVVASWAENAETWAKQGIATAPKANGRQG
jgi:hypothetical protein